MLWSIKLLGRKFIRRFGVKRPSYPYAKLCQEGANHIGCSVKLSGTINLGYATTLGGFNQIIGGTINIGRYCQIAPFAALYALNHPLNYITTYVNSNLFDGSMKKHQSDEEVILENDIWLGHGAIVLPGVRVRSGAVIAAGAVVTKDVQPYAIVAGCPAVEIRKRFPEPIITLLLELRWWQMSPADLRRIAWLFDVPLDKDESNAIAAIKRAIVSCNL